MIVALDFDYGPFGFADTREPIPRREWISI